jgi:hypothetical protein
VFVLYASESASRAVREAQVAKVKANSEIAFWAAEAGFNRARAALIGGANAAALDNLDVTTSVALASYWGGEAGKYTLTVTPNGNGTIFTVESTGYYGEGKYEAKRVVSGTIELVNPVSPGPPPRAVKTIYDK